MTFLCYDHDDYDNALLNNVPTSSKEEVFESI